LRRAALPTQDRPAPAAVRAAGDEGVGEVRKSKPEPRKNDPQRTQQDILAVATEEFAAHGLAGARVDAIALKTRTSKRMIYYYFGSKEGLYIAVLEKVYREIRAEEATLNLADLPPEEALRRLIESTVEHDEAHPYFVRLVSIENIHQAQHMLRSASIRELNVSVIQTLAEILERGHSSGVFRRGVDPVDLHLMISALCFFRVSNRHTFGTIFRRDLSAPATLAAHKRMFGDAILAYLREAA
jgi:AcrR family transcriptional regulator